MIHGSYLEKEIHCLEENKSFQASLSSRPCLSEETGHTGFIGCRSSSIHWTWQWTRFNVLGTKGLLSRSQWNTSCSQYHPNTSRGLASQVPKYHHSCQPVPLRFQKQLWGWEDWRQEEKWETGQESWMASPTQRTWVWETLGGGEGEGSLECRSLWGQRVRHYWVIEEQPKYRWIPRAGVLSLGPPELSGSITLCCGRQRRGWGFNSLAASLASASCI